MSGLCISKHQNSYKQHRCPQVPNECGRSRNCTAYDASDVAYALSALHHEYITSMHRSWDPSTCFVRAVGLPLHVVLTSKVLIKSPGMLIHAPSIVSALDACNEIDDTNRTVPIYTKADCTSVHLETYYTSQLTPRKTEKNSEIIFRKRTLREQQSIELAKSGTEPFDGSVWRVGTCRR